MTDAADILVIGAGPAGCAVALHALQHGLRVIVFDAKEGPRRAPGETLHPGIEPIFEALGVLDQVQAEDFYRHQGVWLKRKGTRVFVPYGEDAQGPWRGFQTERQALHRILQEALVQRGGTLLLKKRPDRVLMHQGRVWGVGCQGEDICARFTVDATGRTAWLSGQIGLVEKIFSPPLAARFGWREGELTHLEGQPCFTTCEDGWMWQAPLKDDRHAWVRLKVGGPGAAPPGVEVTWKLRPQCAMPGLFLVGDAAASLDPSSSHGVLRALMGGMLAASLMTRCVESRVLEAHALAHYRAWICEQFAHDAKHLRQLLYSPFGGFEKFRLNASYGDSSLHRAPS